MRPAHVRAGRRKAIAKGDRTLSADFADYTDSNKSGCKKHSLSPPAIPTLKGFANSVRNRNAESVRKSPPRVELELQR